MMNTKFQPSLLRQLSFTPKRGRHTVRELALQSPGPRRRKPIRLELRLSRGMRSKIYTESNYEGKIKNVDMKNRFAIIVAKFNSLVTTELLNGARKALDDFGVTSLDVFWVPGSFELPSVAKSLAELDKYSAIICLGAVIRGGTSHYDAVVSATTSGILQASLSAKTPVIFGVLTCDTMEQALDRAGGKMGNKGYEAALTAMEMADLNQQIKNVKYS